MMELWNNFASANPTKWSNTLKQFVSNLSTNCLSVFDHFVILAPEGLMLEKWKHLQWRSSIFKIPFIVKARFMQCQFATGWLSFAHIRHINKKLVIFVKFESTGQIGSIFDKFCKKLKKQNFTVKRSRSFPPRAKVSFLKRFEK